MDRQIIASGIAVRRQQVTFIEDRLVTACERAAGRGRRGKRPRRTGTPGTGIPGTVTCARPSLKNTNSAPSYAACTAKSRCWSGSRCTLKHVHILGQCQTGQSAGVLDREPS